MPLFTVRTLSRESSRELCFQADSECLESVGFTASGPIIDVREFDASNDIYYRVPAGFPVSQLEQEIEIHVPPQFRSSSVFQVEASALSDGVLMQKIKPNTSYLSPLAALRALLDAIGEVNSGVLQCDGDCMLLVRKAGEHYSAAFSPRSLKDFMAIDAKLREEVFRDFRAMRIYLCGSDANAGLLDPKPDDLIEFRMLDESAVAASPSLKLGSLKGSLHEWSLAIGAALVYQGILREAQLLP